ncbi:hypothetical protein NX059_011489 [Plenodomus lindquistii]|nr:hypothetical protein NX059_011489 [Plenodomus lindquistii]
MQDSKAGAEAVHRPVDNESLQNHALSEKRGTSHDQKDMYRMGKEQEFRRNFGFVSIFGYSMVLMATWETMTTTLMIPLINGGTGGLVVMYIITVLGMFLVIISMAEMSSMAPTSGGQYHWVSEFAPKKYQKFLSYVVGWLCVLGFQTGIASIGFLAAGQIQGLMILNNSSYIPERWHSTLLTIAVATFAIVFNTILARKLPLVEGIVLVLHIFGFFAFIITLWVLAPRSTPQEVFGSFQDNAGWGSIGLSVLVGQVSPIFALAGADAATHMSEELQDAAHTLPRSMLWTAIVNSSLGLVMIITWSFCIGDVESAIMSPTGQPHIQILYNVTGSKAATSVLISVTIIMAIFGCVNNVASTSRQLFAFARDKGVPFSAFFSYVQPGWDLPINSVIITFAISVGLSLINIGSTVALNSIISLGIGALLTSYLISISCLWLKRFRGEPLLPSKFSLGKAGVWVNGIAIVWLVFAFVFSFFPTFPHPAPDVMNWGILIYGIVVTFALVYYYLYGRKFYAGPVEYIRKSV